MVLTGKILGIGNPLLDVSTYTVGEDFLKKYGLKNGNAILAEDKHMPLYNEVEALPDAYYSAGGATLNSMRAAAWMLEKADAVSFIGCIGKDKRGNVLKAEASKANVNGLWLETSEAPTGVCACLIINKERSLCTNLGAARLYDQTHFHSAEVQKAVEEATFFYSSGFFLSDSTDTLEALGKYTAEHKKPLIVNLAATFLIDFFWESFEKVLPYTDIVVGNESEAESVGARFKLGNNLEDIAKWIHALPNVNSNPRSVLFTQGTKPTLLLDGATGNISYYDVKLLPKEQVVDTNGAGDSFVGGFLSQLAQGSSLAVCVDAGHYCAREVVKQSGAVYPGIPKYIPPK